MRTYTLDKKGRPVPGITAENRAIVLGETGRGRKQATVLVPPDAEVLVLRPAEQRVLVSGCYRPLEGGTAFGQNWETPQGAAHAVDQGAKVIRREETPEVSKVTAVPGPGAVVLVRDLSGFRGSWSYEVHGGARVIAEGHCAQGDAGRMGGGPEVLVALGPGSGITCRRTGRLYGEPDTIEVTFESLLTGC